MFCRKVVGVEGCLQWQRLSLLPLGGTRWSVQNTANCQQNWFQLKLSSDRLPEAGNEDSTSTLHFHSQFSMHCMLQTKREWWMENQKHPPPPFTVASSIIPAVHQKIWRRPQLLSAPCPCSSQTPGTLHLTPQCSPAKDKYPVSLNKSSGQHSNKHNYCLWTTLSG